MWNVACERPHACDVLERVDTACGANRRSLLKSGTLLGHPEHVRAAVVRLGQVRSFVDHDQRKVITPKTWHRFKNRWEGWECGTRRTSPYHFGPVESSHGRWGSTTISRRGRSRMLCGWQNEAASRVERRSTASADATVSILRWCATCCGHHFGVSLHCDGSPGAVFEIVRRKKETTYLELIDPNARCRQVVLAGETGGYWIEESRTFAPRSVLVSQKSVEQSLWFRWGSFMACFSATVFAASLWRSRWHRV